MRSYYIRASSFPSPFFPDQTDGSVVAPSAQKALDYFVENYDHPCGLYGARIYVDHHLYWKSKGEDYIIEWLSPEAAKQKDTV
jgi:hypothetical protein